MDDGGTQIGRDGWQWRLGEVSLLKGLAIAGQSHRHDDGPDAFHTLGCGHGIWRIAAKEDIEGFIARVRMKLQER